jgi:pimeloyl-ACP methyl ester carboxylesterase
MPSFPTSDGVRLHYSIRGRGPDLLLLNGLFGDQEFWEPVAEPLSAHRRCILLDHRGIGASERWTGDYSYGLWARDAVELLDRLGIPACPVLGLCHGGMTAAAMAISRPGRVTGLVAHGTRLLESPKTRVYDRFRHRLLGIGGVELVMDAQMGAIFGETVLREVEPYLGRMSGKAHLRMDRESSLKMLEALCSFHLAPEELTSRVPALFLAGEEDLYVPPWLVRRTAAAWPGSEFLELPGIGHIVPREAPGEMVRLTLDFLERHGI